MQVKLSFALVVLFTWLACGCGGLAADRMFIYASSQMNKAAELKCGKSGGAQAVCG